jgi:hypothetical protein
MLGRSPERVLTHSPADRTAHRFNDQTVETRPASALRTCNSTSSTQTYGSWERPTSAMLASIATAVSARG